MTLPMPALDSVMKYPDSREKNSKGPFFWLEQRAAPDPAFWEKKDNLLTFL
jgi:hypothetical protein